MDITQSIQYLKGVGPKRAIELKKLQIETIEDLLLCFPRTYIDRQHSRCIEELEPETHHSIVLELKRIQISGGWKRGRGSRLTACFTDGKREMTGIWFNAGAWLISRLKPGVEVWLDGVVKIFNEMPQMTHPNIEVIKSENNTNETDRFFHDLRLIPVYSMTEKISQNYFRNLVHKCYSQFGSCIEETLPENVVSNFSLPSRAEAIAKVHFPESLEQAEKSRKRFAFEEMLYHQMMLARVYHNNKKQRMGVSFINKKLLTTAFKEKLPFNLTSAQKKAIREIFSDMISDRKMNRLLQGDVCSGKTVVALFAMLLAIENEFQAVLLVPTEILAKQHYDNIAKMMSHEPKIKPVLLLGGVSKAKKEKIAAISQGEYNLIIGTHALLEDKVSFKKVGLIVIDEQQRFGVMQRARLPERAGNPDVLYLTATPIPRSLALTLYGDLDVSVMDELPPNRKQIKTVLYQSSDLIKVFQKIDELITQKRQIYVVCPLISESEKMDLQDAERFFEELKNNRFKERRVAIIHSRFKQNYKETIMSAFVKGDTDILVSTTVIEVGVDVPNASAMLIIHAERFGLSQLHQLRGRVGRGNEESFCFLISYPPVSSTARNRLNTMVRTNDGFKIAEKDLELRGPGDFFGTVQSGNPVFRFVDVIRDQKMTGIVRELAFAIIKDDHNLNKPQNFLLRQRYLTQYLSREKLFVH